MYKVFMDKLLKILKDIKKNKRKVIPYSWKNNKKDVPDTIFKASNIIKLIVFLS